MRVFFEKVRQIFQSQQLLGNRERSPNHLPHRLLHGFNLRFHRGQTNTRPVARQYLLSLESAVKRCFARINDLSIQKAGRKFRYGGGLILMGGGCVPLGAGPAAAGGFAGDVGKHRSVLTFGYAAAGLSDTAAAH